MKERNEKAGELVEAQRFAAEIERGVGEAIEGLRELEEYFEMTQSTMLLEPIISRCAEKREASLVEIALARSNPAPINREFRKAA